MSLQQQKPMATAAAAAVAAPSLMTQVGMAGSAAVITVSFIHPIDVVKVSNFLRRRQSDGSELMASEWRLYDGWCLFMIPYSATGNACRPMLCISNFKMMFFSRHILNLLPSHHLNQQKHQ